MEDELKSYENFINEVTKEVVYPTDFKGMVQVAISGVYTSIMAIAQELANEKASRNPGRYKDTTIEEVDITRAMNMVFHSNWKANLKEKAIGAMMLASQERASKKDHVVAQKNERAMRLQNGGTEDTTIDTSVARFSDAKDGTGTGSNQ